MTIQTVMILNDSQRAYLIAAIGCLLAVQGQAAAPPAQDFATFEDLRDDALALATAYGTVSPLDHQDGQDLLEALGAADRVLFTSDEQLGCECAFVEAAAAAHCRL